MDTSNNNDCGCSNTTITYSHCNECSPVETCACPIKDLGTDCILYSDDNIECNNVIVITKNTNLTTVLNGIVTYMCNRFTEIVNHIKLKNVGTGFVFYSGDTLLGEKKIRSLKQTGNLISIIQNTEDITLNLDTSTIQTVINTTVTGAETKVNAGTNITVTGNGTVATPYVINTPTSIIPDGSETKVVAGTNTTVTGIGTITNPYIVSSDLDGSETKVVAGTNMAVTGTGTISTPYVVNSTATGEETKVTAGTNTTVTGTGTISTPYVINSTGGDGSETKIIAGIGTMISGSGTVSTPYQINIPKNNVVNAGFFAGLNVATVNALTVGGDITAATTVGITTDSIVTITFANAMPNTDYYLDVRLQGQSANLNDDNDICTPVFKVISTTQAQIGFREVSGNTQSLKVHVQAIAY